MIAWLTVAWHTYIQHPLTGRGYQWWSGAGSDFGEATLITAIVGSAVVTYRQHECHMNGCHRPAWHPDPANGHPVCRKHHPHSLTTDGLQRKAPNLMTLPSLPSADINPSQDSDGGC